MHINDSIWNDTYYEYCPKPTINCSTFDQFCTYYSETDCGCGNFTEEDKISCYEYFSTPTMTEWLLVCLHAIVFLAGIAGNLLVCLAVIQNPRMRTVTNLLIVNLAVADLLVIVICLPPTVAWDVTSTWFLGRWLCKIVIYLQVSCFTFF